METRLAKVLISSTSEDLREYRARLFDTLRRLQPVDGVGMEWFGASAKRPVDLCKAEVEQVDLVVLVLAHRYGWVPSQDEGGDGERSITRIEYEHALSQDKPVLAFLVDDKAPWTGARDRDRLTSDLTDAQALEVLRDVRLLDEFKRQVNAKHVRDTFVTPADLADKVGAALANWLLQRQHAQLQSASTRDQAASARPQAPSARAELKRLRERVASHLKLGEHEVAAVYLTDALQTAQPQNLPVIADLRLSILFEYRPHTLDDKLLAAAQAVLEKDGQKRALAHLVLGQIKSQRVRDLWASGERQAAWQLADEARVHFDASIQLESHNPDTYGSLGGLLKRMAKWAHESGSDQARALEDAMLNAYERGWKRVPHAYPLLNYIEQRAVLCAKRNPQKTRALIGEKETELREALSSALKDRESQLGNRQDRPWAAFDVARARHYLKPNVPGFLEDLERALEEARSVMKSIKDNFMISTTCDSLRSLLEAGVTLEGLAEGLDYLETAARDQLWYQDRARRPDAFLDDELSKLQQELRKHVGQLLSLTQQQTHVIHQFVEATQLRWSREDEERYQLEFQEKVDELGRKLEPRELKIARTLWKVFGSKALGWLTAGAPVDWNEVGTLVVTKLK